MNIVITHLINFMKFWYFEMDPQTLVGVLIAFTVSQRQMLLTLEALLNDNKPLHNQA